MQSFEYCALWQPSVNMRHCPLQSADEGYLIDQMRRCCVTSWLLVVSCMCVLVLMELVIQIDNTGIRLCSAPRG